MRLIEVMPEEIASPEMTGKWELALHEITDGKQDAERFLAGIRRMSSFLVEYARDKGAAVDFPPEDRSGGRKGGKARPARALEGTVCPLCGKGKLTESPRAFSCTEKGCSCTIWKDCLTRGGGPELNEKLIRLLLDRKELKGSTGILQLKDGWIRFIPNGSETPSVSRSLNYTKSPKR